MKNSSAYLFLASIAVLMTVMAPERLMVATLTWVVYFIGVAIVYAIREAKQ
jgi:hypothetical protein